MFTNIRAPETTTEDYGVMRMSKYRDQCISRVLKFNVVLEKFVFVDEENKTENNAHNSHCF